MLGNSFGYTIEDSLQIVQLTSLLYLDKNDLVFTVTRFNIHAIEFVVGFLLIAFTFQNFDDVDRLVEKNGNQSFEYPKVCFVAQHSFGCPVKTDEFVVVFHVVVFLWQTYEKKMI